MASIDTLEETQVPFYPPRRRYHKMEFPLGDRKVIAYIYPIYSYGVDAAEEYIEGKSNIGTTFFLYVKPQEVELQPDQLTQVSLRNNSIIAYLSGRLKEYLKLIQKGSANRLVVNGVELTSDAFEPETLKVTVTGASLICIYGTITNILPPRESVETIVKEGLQQSPEIVFNEEDAARAAAAALMPSLQLMNETWSHRLADFFDLQDASGERQQAFANEIAEAFRKLNQTMSEHLEAMRRERRSIDTEFQSLNGRLTQSLHILNYLGVEEILKITSTETIDLYKMVLATLENVEEALAHSEITEDIQIDQQTIRYLATTYYTLEKAFKQLAFRIGYRTEDSDLRTIAVQFQQAGIECRRELIRRCSVQLELLNRTQITELPALLAFEFPEIENYLTTLLETLTKSTNN